jgi:N-acetylglucosamine-6-phosphate deacetylase
MMKMIINGKILAPQPLPEGVGILIEGEKIKTIAPVSQFSSSIETIDAQGKWVVPGLIDVHIHGSFGSDTMDHDHQTLDNLSQFLAKQGVTSFLPTTVASSDSEILAVIERAGTYHQHSAGSRLLGIHLEGPYLQDEYRGAQDAQFLRPAQPEEYLPWLKSGVVKLMTVAPEIEGVMDLIETGQKMDVRFAIGHSDATYEMVIKAVERGLTQATHTFNAMPPLHHRNPGVLGAVLMDDRVFTQVIADGVHLHPAIVDLLFKVKGVEKNILITDAIRAAGQDDGIYVLGTQTITVENGVARTESGALAGSTLLLHQAIKNSAAFTHRNWQDLLPSATCVPAKSLGLENQIGSLKPGAYADIVFMDEHHVPCFTMVAGNIVFDNSKPADAG